MKKIFLGLALVAGLVSFKWMATQPLENTRWKGLVNAPAPTEAEFEFKKDSFLLYVQGQVFETMAYTVNGDTLRISKLDGNSPCNDEVGMYNFSIKDDKLFLKVNNDPCGIRAAAFNESYSKQ
jgi:hypothetical protein